MNTNNLNNINDGISNRNNTVIINNGYGSENLVSNIQKRQKGIIIYGLTGIDNSTGTTCYMNSAIQALSHNYPLTSYLFNNKKEIFEIIKKNAKKILKDNDMFKIDNTNSLIPLNLREKIGNDNYHPNMLTEDESIIVYNHTITAQLTRLLENMWAKNCVVIPTSFKKVFCEARDKFFYGLEQHDAEEAYSCILQKMQEELAETKNVVFRSNQSVQEYLNFKNAISAKIQESRSIEEKKKLMEQYTAVKRKMPHESLTVEAFREMKKYYGNSYSRITEIFTGFLRSSISCPDDKCRFSSNKFEPFLHVTLPIPINRNYNTHTNTHITIDDCMDEYCKIETLDDQNLWLCEGCNRKVKAEKRIELWTCPPVLVIQLNRFGIAKISKDGRFVKFPLENFDISPMISQIQHGTDKCNKYRLQCVINHTGNLNGGHYFTYCLDEDSNKWFIYNDENVSEIPKSSIVTQYAYLLFYIREDMINS